MTMKSGFAKIQNVELPAGRQLIPEFVFIERNAWRPCSLPATIVHHLGPAHNVARIGFESEMNLACWINIDTARHRCIRRYGDSSALYECEIEDAQNLRQEVSLEHEDFNLRLYHHTSREALPKIFGSRQLRASRWNYEGTKEHVSRHFVYFTDVPVLDTPDGFARAAMSEGGMTIGLEYDQPWYGVEILNVPKRSKRSADAKIELLVQPDLIELQPMLYHDQAFRNEGLARYWELLQRNIFRIPVYPGGFVTVTEQRQIITEKEVVGLQIPDTVLAGCAFIKGQARVVFDEDEQLGYKIVRARGQHWYPLERFLCGGPNLIAPRS